MKCRLPEVVVLIPFYGPTEALETSLRSLAQEPLMHDVIVVDDGNIPPLEVSPSWHSRVTLVRHEKNAGITAALNTGLQYAIESGYVYIARLDAGDRTYAGRLAKQVSYLQGAPECQLVGGQARSVDKNGRLLFASKVPTDSAAIWRGLHRRSCFIHPTVMFRSDAIKTVGFYRDKYPAAEDYDLFFRIAERFPTANFTETFLDYEVSDGSISSRRRRRQMLSKLLIILEHFDPAMMESYVGVLEALIGLTLSRSNIANVHSLRSRLEDVFRKGTGER